MKHLVRDISFGLSKIDRRYIQLILVILSTILFVIGAGAPEGGGTGPGQGPG